MKLIIISLVLSFAYSLHLSPAIQLQASDWLGTWTESYMTPNNEFLFAARLKLQEKQEDEDNTAANGVNFQYRPKDSNEENSFIPKEQKWGFWGHWINCNADYFIDGFAARMQSYCVQCDYTAMNGLRIHCRNQKNGKSYWTTVSDGFWGKWQSYIAPEGYYAVGFKVKLQEGKHKDHTGLNGINMKFKTKESI